MANALFERLKKAREAAEVKATPSTEATEAPPVEAMKAPPTEAPSEDSPVLADLKRRVNPPTEENTDFFPPEEAKPEGERDADGKEVCPNCGKGFKNLSRHKCKSAAPTAEEAAAQALVDDMNANTDAGLPATPEGADPAEVSVAQQLKNKLNSGGKHGDGIVPEGGETPPEKDPSELEKEEEQSEKRAEPAAAPVDVFREHDQKPKAPKTGYTLLIDCVVERAEDEDSVIDFTSLIEPLQRAIAAENGVEWWSSVEYGKGPGLLAGKLDNMMAEEMPTGIITVDSSMLETRACKSVLKRNAVTVIQGVR